MVAALVDRIAGSRGTPWEAWSPLTHLEAGRDQSLESEAS